MEPGEPGARPERETQPYRVRDGTIRIYRVFDVADGVDLARAEALAASTASRFRLERSRTHSAIEIPHPPVRLRLGPRTVPIAGQERRVEVTANVYDYGVVSVVMELPIAPGTTLDELLPVSVALLDAPTPDVDAAARKEAGEVAQALRLALEKPHAWDGLETYTVFFVRSFDRRVTGRELLDRAPLARLLLGEGSADALAPGERSDVLKHAFSYLETDLAVVDWNSAFVHEPSGIGDVADLLEIATAILLELRYYDALLDRELRSIYEQLDHIRPRGVLTRRYATLLRRTAGLLLEISEMVERLENAVKFVGDFYLARLYHAALQRFRLPEWQATVLRKQRMLSDVNRMLSDAADVRRAELLELTIIVLIAWEIFWAFVIR